MFRPSSLRHLFATLCLGAVLVQMAGCRRDTAGVTEEAPPGGVILTFPSLPVTPVDETPPNWIACLFSDLRMPFQQAQAEFIRLVAAQDKNFTVHIYDAGGDASRQELQVASLLADRPAAVLIDPISFEGLQALGALKKSGAPVIGLSTDKTVDVPLDHFDTFVVCDPFDIGREAAGVILRALEKRARQMEHPESTGRVLQLRGSDSNPWSDRVHEGLVSLLDKEQGVRLVHDAPAEWSPALAAQRMREGLRLQQTVDVVFAHDDRLAHAAHNVAVEAGIREQMLIVGVNAFTGPEGGIEMIRRQELDASIYRHFQVDFAWRLARHALSKPGFKFKPLYQLKRKAITPAALDNLGPAFYPKEPTF